MGLGRKLNPGYLVASICFLGEDDEGEKVVAVEKLASTKKVQHIKDAVDVNGSRT